MHSIASYLCSHKLGDSLFEHDVLVDRAIKPTRAAATTSIIIKGFDGLSLDIWFCTHPQEVERSDIENRITNTLYVNVVAVNALNNLQQDI